MRGLRGGAATARAGIEPTATLKVPLFRSLLERIHAERRFVVLDLGAAQNGLLDVLAGRRCRLDIADIADGIIDALNSEPEPEVGSLEALAELSLPAWHGEPTDVILCWDLLNYLEKPALSALMARIAARASPGAMAHALIAYSAPTMPVSPARYVPVDDGHLVDRAPPGPERPATRYSPEDLRLTLREYQTERAVLLGNGMQEYLFKVSAAR